MDSKISVIVPIYNTAEYLPECLDSLVGQTYQNLEIILIDDGSTDDSGRIADEYAARDARIKVIHKENGGVSRARNVGIDRATGDYIAFVDSDDAIVPVYFENMLRFLQKEQGDICCCVSQVMDTPPYVERPKAYYVFSRDEALENLLLAKHFGCGINKIYASKLWKDYRVPEDITINEDLLMNYVLFSNASRICFIDRHYYHYRHRVGSASRSVFSRKNLDTIKATQAVMLNTETQKLRHAAQNRYYLALSNCHRGTTITPGFDAERREIESLIRKGLKELLKNPHLSLRKKAELLIQGYFGRIYRIIWTKKHPCPTEV